ncbi:MAG: hypothetical protein GF317_05005 [Candidatus Lokiarchaeota archaeon]|nr:hypothetical protein [Candidatus Lokiarchaeota archaeon]MBD3199164.1 hypothetical protein [Candidatus Lokiarchaeota archaeon]
MSSDENKYLKPLILDIGCDKFKLGWSGGDFPDIIAPSIYVDRTDYLFNSDVIEGLEDIFIKKEENEYLFGHEALKYQNILKVHEFKKENNYNILSRFFKYYYQQLEIPSEYQFLQPIIIVSPFIMTDLEKTKLQNIFFEEFDFPFLLFLSESKSVLSTLNKSDGVVVNIGESFTYISTIFHGFTNIMARDVFPVSGKELTNHFLNMILTGRGTGKNFYLDYWLAKEIKEKMSLCVLNPKKERRRVKEGFTKYDRTIKLPDNSKIKINQERFMLSEPIFDPKIIHIDYKTLDEIIAKVIKFWDRENWEQLVGSIILSGGGSLIPGLKERLKEELKKHFTDKLKKKIKIIAPAGRENMAWIGGSILFMQGKLEEGWMKNPKLEESNLQEETSTE